MRFGRRPVCICAAVLLMVVMAGSGCSKKITISQIPAFYDGSIKAIAIVPFRNQTDHEGAGNILSDKLASMLMANGTYKVYNRNDHRVLSDERDLQLDLGKNPEKVEAMFQQLGDVQAILVGSVSTYADTSRSQQRQEPIQQYNQITKQWYIAGYRTFVYTRNEANVAASAALLRRDGSTIYATPVPATDQRWAEGSPPQFDVHSLLASAGTNVAYRLMSQFAVVRREIELDPGKALRTASEWFEGTWTHTDRFSPDAEQIIVVLALPPSCDRNRFELKIVRKNQRKYLAERTIFWDGSKGSIGYPFSAKDLLADGGGPGVFTVKFFAGQEPTFTRDFHIR